MKLRVLMITVVALMILPSCSKNSPIESLETSVVEQKISSTDINSSDNSFALGIPLKTKGGKDLSLKKERSLD